MLPVPPRIPVRNAQAFPARRSWPDFNLGDGSTNRISGRSPRVKKIWLVSASTPPEATLERAPHAPQNTMVRSEYASQAGIPASRRWETGLVVVSMAFRKDARAYPSQTKETTARYNANLRLPDCSFALAPSLVF